MVVANVTASACAINACHRHSHLRGLVVCEAIVLIVEMLLSVLTVLLLVLLLLVSLLQLELSNALVQLVDGRHLAVVVVVGGCGVVVIRVVWSHLVGLHAHD